MNERIIYTPRSGSEMQKATNNVPIYLYSELCQRAKREGSLGLLVNMANRCLDNVILLQDPDNMRSGHWTSLSFHPERREIYFFSTYGGKPDVEKNAWLAARDLRSSGQDINILNDGLKQLQQKGWKIHYNEYRYQNVGDDTACCGIYTAAFLRFGQDPEKFWDVNRKIKASGQDPAVVYYKKYFL